MENTLLSNHFKLGEFLNLGKYSDNIPTMQHVANMTYGCLMLLEPARQVVGPIIINSGFRNAQVNRQVGGVSGSQHLLGQAADIRPKDPAQFQRLVNYLKTCEYTDQLSRERIRLSSEGNDFSVGFLFGELAEMQYLCRQLERYESEIRIIL